MLNSKTLMELRLYIKEHQESLVLEMKEEVLESSYSIKNNELEDYIRLHQQPTLQQVLFQFIDSKGESDVKIYKKAGLDRKHFSKIRSNSNYRISKNTATALALALELNRKETEELLSAAGFTLSDSDTGDLIIQFCLENNIYNIHEVNYALEYFKVKPLTVTHE
ncbi:hypothetical protein ACLIBG_02580 [Virgibacillus sp. W0181]|uniref:hypothetical protein n=1 Tax=Virgibacillus sp. W0181 TaxID=3391581 RepID=UPI003F455A4E